MIWLGGKQKKSHRINQLQININNVYIYTITAEKDGMRVLPITYIVLTAYFSEQLGI